MEETTGSQKRLHHAHISHVIPEELAEPLSLPYSLETISNPPSQPPSSSSDVEKLSRLPAPSSPFPVQPQFASPAVQQGSSPRRPPANVTALAIGSTTGSTSDSGSLPSRSMTAPFGRAPAISPMTSNGESVSLGIPVFHPDFYAALGSSSRDATAAATSGGSFALDVNNIGPDQPRDSLQREISTEGRPGEPRRPRKKKKKPKRRSRNRSNESAAGSSSRATMSSSLEGPSGAGTDGEAESGPEEYTPTQSQGEDETEMFELGRSPDDTGNTGNVVVSQPRRPATGTWWKVTAIAVAAVLAALALILPLAIILPGNGGSKALPPPVEPTCAPKPAWIDPDNWSWPTAFLSLAALSNANASTNPDPDAASGGGFSMFTSAAPSVAIGVSHIIHLYRGESGAPLFLVYHKWNGSLAQGPTDVPALLRSVTDRRALGADACTRDGAPLGEGGVRFFASRHRWLLAYVAVDTMSPTTRHQMCFLESALEEPVGSGVWARWVPGNVSSVVSPVGGSLAAAMQRLYLFRPGEGLIGSSLVYSTTTDSGPALSLDATLHVENLVSLPPSTQAGSRPFFPDHLFGRLIPAVRSGPIPTRQLAWAQRCSLLVGVLRPNSAGSAGMLCAGNVTCLEVHEHCVDPGVPIDSTIEFVGGGVSIDTTTSRGAASSNSPQLIRLALAVLGDGSCRDKAPSVAGCLPEGSVRPLSPYLVMRGFPGYQVLLGAFVERILIPGYEGVRWFELRRSFPQNETSASSTRSHARSSTSSSGGGAADEVDGSAMSGTSGAGDGGTADDGVAADLAAAGPWVLHQQGPLRFIAGNRWLGSISMDRYGNIVTAVAVPGGATGLRYFGRMPCDPPGLLPRIAAATVQGVAPSPVVRSVAYWARSTMLAMDPADDCTFFVAATDGQNHTLATFAFPQCKSNFGTPLLNVNGLNSAGLTPTDTSIAVGPDYVLQVYRDATSPKLAIIDKWRGELLQKPMPLAYLYPSGSACALDGFAGKASVLYLATARIWVLAHINKFSSGPTLCVIVNLASPLGPWAQVYGIEPSLLFTTNLKPEEWHLAAAHGPSLIASFNTTHGNLGFAVIGSYTPSNEIQLSIALLPTVASNIVFKNNLLPASVEGPVPEAQMEKLHRCGVYVHVVYPFLEPGLTQSIDNPCAAHILGHASEEFGGAGDTPAGTCIEIFESCAVDGTDVGLGDTPQALMLRRVSVGKGPCDATNPGVACFTPENPANRTHGIASTLAGRGLYPRLVHRVFPEYEVLLGSLVELVEDSDDGPARAGIRWFELRRGMNATTGTTGPWRLYQEGTVAPPDGHHRWLSSIAMDKFGNVALAYAVTDAGPGALASSPSLRYSGRLACDPLGEMPRGEHSLVEGDAPARNGSLWGVSSSLVVDPEDDCTFYVAGPYGGGQVMRLAAFSFPECISSRHTRFFTGTSCDGRAS